MDDVIVGKTAYGNVAERLMASNFNINSLRTNAVLLPNEWKIIDTAVISAAEPRLQAVGDLMSRGLVYRTGTGLGQTILESYKDWGDFFQMD